MKDYVAVVAVSAEGKVEKFQDFDLLSEADSHVVVHGGFSTSTPSGSWKHWVADPVAKTLVLDTAANDNAAKERVRRAISAEAERRLVEGTVINSVQVKCRNDDFTRLSELEAQALYLEANSLPVSIEFRTEGGAYVPITSSAEVQALRVAALGFATHILSTSASLQKQAEAGTLPADFDPTADTHW